MRDPGFPSHPSSPTSPSSPASRILLIQRWIRVSTSHTLVPLLCPIPSLACLQLLKATRPGPTTTRTSRMVTIMWVVPPSTDAVECVLTAAPGALRSRVRGFPAELSIRSRSVCCTTTLASHGPEFPTAARPQTFHRLGARRVLGDWCRQRPQSPGCFRPATQQQ